MRKALWAAPAPEAEILKRLLGEAIPSRLIARAATIGASGKLDAPADERRRNGVNYLHGVTDGRIEKPPAKNAWWIGQAASAVSNERWFSPPLVLFACGHFSEFATVLLNADERQLPPDRKRQLMDHLPTVLEPNQPRPSRDDLVREHLERGHDELAARRAADWDVQMPPAVRLDRVAWSLSGSENESLNMAWQKSHGQPLDLSNAAIAACHLASSGRVEKTASSSNVAYVTRVLIAKNAIQMALSS